MVIFLKPTKNKILLSLLPLYILTIPIVMLFILGAVLMPISLQLSKIFIVLALAYLILVSVITIPVENFLQSTGLVQNYGSAFFDVGPPNDISFLGIMVTGLTLSLILYSIISVISWKIGKKKGNVKKKKMGKK